MNHLRYLKSNLKELEILKIIYLNRAGINVIPSSSLCVDPSATRRTTVASVLLYITSQHLNRHICEQRRDELGIYWTRINGLVLIFSMETPRQNQTVVLMQPSCRNLFPVCQTIGLADVDMCRTYISTELHIYWLNP